VITTRANRTLTPFGGEGLENDSVTDATSPPANRFADAQSVEELLGQVIGYGRRQVRR
jgi:hypothetical protein